MTCIAAVEHNGTVTIGADSAVSWGVSTTICSERKVWSRRGAVWGYAGECRADNLIRHVNVARYGGGDPWRWLLGEVVPMIDTAFGDVGLEPAGMDLLIGVGGQIFNVDCKLGVHGVGCGYHAGGSGCDYALGALSALPATMGARTRVKKALEAAARHCTTVAAPFSFVSC